MVDFSRVFGIPALLLLISMLLFRLVMPRPKQDLARTP